MTVVAYRYRQWSLNENQTCVVHSEPERVKFRVAKVICYNGITNPASNRPHQTHTSRPTGGWQRGETLSQIHFLLIGALDSQRTPSNGSRRPLGHTDILGAPLRGWPLCGAHIQSSGLSTGWGGDWGQTPWAHPLVLHASRKPALFLLLLLLLLLLFYPCYWVEWGCFNPRIIPGVSLWALICNTPLGNEALPDWHPESASRLWLCM